MIEGAKSRTFPGYDAAMSDLLSAELESAVARLMDMGSAQSPASTASRKFLTVMHFPTLNAPLFQFRNYGEQLPNHWSTISNEAAFGSDYFTRTAVAKSNIFVNSPNETKYYYQDLDAAGMRLNGANHYTITFPKDQTPPVNGFWSLTLYNEYHFFNPNDLKRYSLGTKNKDLNYNSDGSCLAPFAPCIAGAERRTCAKLAQGGHPSIVRQCPLWVKSRHLRGLNGMSAIPPKADIGERNWDVRFVPKADIAKMRAHRVEHDDQVL